MDAIEATGRIISVRDPVVEVEFSRDPRPKVHDIVYLKENPQIRMLVIKSSDELRYHCVSLSDTRLIARGAKVVSSGTTLKLPVGESLMGRVVDLFGNPKDGLGEIKNVEEMPIFTDALSYEEVSTKVEILETGIKIIDLFAPLQKGGKMGLFGGSGVGKSMLLTEILRNIINKDKENNKSVFCGIGERSREGQELYEELKHTGVLDHVSLIYGPMGESPSIRFLSAFSGTTIAEYIRDGLGKNVLVFIDNIFRFAQAGNEMSILMGNIPSEGGYQPTLPTEVAIIHERLTSRKDKSITTIEAIYLPEDDIFDPAAQSVFDYLDSSIVLSRDAYKEGRLPAVDILSSGSDSLSPGNVSGEHYYTATKAKSMLKKAESLERIVSLVGESELSEEDRIIYKRSRKLINYMTQNFFVASNQTGKPGVYVPLSDTVAVVRDIMDGKYDEVFEDKFLFIGGPSDIKK